VLGHCLERTRMPTSIPFLSTPSQYYIHLSLFGKPDADDFVSRSRRKDSPSSMSMTAPSSMRAVLDPSSFRRVAVQDPFCPSK
jgi:hypothetical protein